MAKKKAAPGQRREQVEKLLDQDKKAPEIAKALGISTNAVYQHIRKIKDGKGGGTTKARKAGAKPSAPAAMPPIRPEPTPAASNGADPVAATRERGRIVKDAISANEKVKADAEREITKLTAESKRLDAGLKALTGRPQRKPRAKAKAKA